MTRGTLHGIIGCVAAVLLAGTANAASTDVGTAIKNAGGSDFSVRAGDAIRATCADLAAENTRTDGLTGATADLFGRCGNMVRTTLNEVGGNQAVPNDYGLTSDDQVYATLRQFSGEETSSQGRYATEGSNGLNAAVTSRLAAIRGGARTSGIAMNFSGVDLTNALAGTTGAGAPVLLGGNAGEAEGDLGWAWFGKFDYGFGDRDASANEDEYDADSYGGTLGADYAFNENLVVGVAGGYTRHQIDFKSSELSAAVDPVSGGSMDIDTWTLSGFVDLRDGARYLSAIASYGGSDYDMKRLVVVPAATGPVAPAAAQNRRIVSDTQADQYGVSIQFGRTFGQEATTYDLYGGFDLNYVDVDSYVETDLDGGSLGLAFGDQDIRSRQWIVGGTARRAINTGSGVLSPYATVEWHKEIANDGRFVDARYALAVGDVNNDGVSDNFALPTDDPDDSYFEVSLGIAGQLPNNLLVYFEYNAVAGLKDTTANLITLGIRGTF